MAQNVITAAIVYAAIGVAVALWFLLWRIGRIDPAAAGAISFRVLLIPGVVMLWPIVLWRGS